MAGKTEAACLLESGSLYTRRVVLQPEAGDPIFAGWKQAAFSLYFGDAPVYHFDPEGRWQRAFVGGTHYLKGLDTTVQAIERVREGENLVLKRRTLSFAEASDLDAAVRSTALDLLLSLGSDRLDRVDPPPGVQPLGVEELRTTLEAVGRWDAARWFAQRETYLGTYGPLPILPPDCQNPVVLQATLGNARGVTFGGAPEAPHYVRSPDEFDSHARTVAELLGRRVLQCKSAFLAGSDVLVRTPDEVTSYLETIARVFDALPGGVHSFLDDPAGDRPDRETWRQYAARGLTRVTLRVESGDAGVRALFGKSWEDRHLRAVVSDLKESGIGVGVMVLVGAGGSEFSDRHVDATPDLIHSLPLGPGDLVSLLDANEVARAAAPGRRAAPAPLTGEAWAAQHAELRRRLAPLRSRGVKVAPYSLEKQGLL
jgi:hypothetical protein